MKILKQRSQELSSEKLEGIERYRNANKRNASSLKKISFSKGRRRNRFSNRKQNNVNHCTHLGKLKNRRKNKCLYKDFKAREPYYDFFHLI